MYPGTIRSRNRQPHRLGSRAEDELVIRDLLLRPGDQVSDSDSLPLPVDGRDFSPRANIQAQVRVESLRSLNQQAISIRYHATYVVRQAAVRVRDVLIPFDEDDLSILRQPPCSCSGRGSAGDASDYDYSGALRHSGTPFNIGRV